jgi:hypothetical protein
MIGGFAFGYGALSNWVLWSIRQKSINSSSSHNSRCGIPQRSRRLVNYDGSNSISGLRMSFNTFSQSVSGLRSPALARAMIFLAMVFFTSSPQSPIRRPVQTCSNATSRMRSVSLSNCSPLKKGPDWLGASR